MLFKEFNTRCQVDLIDIQSSPDGEYKFKPYFQDDLTKFVSLLPLKSKTAEEDGYQLLDIFTTTGAPSVLQSDNGEEFANQIEMNLYVAWTKSVTRKTES